MKKNVAAAWGVIEPVIGVHRDDSINPLCGLGKLSYTKMAFKIWLSDNQIDWKLGDYFFRCVRNYRSSYWVKTRVRIRRRILSFLSTVNAKIHKTPILSANNRRNNFENMKKKARIFRKCINCTPNCYRRTFHRYASYGVNRIAGKFDSFICLFTGE